MLTRAAVGAAVGLSAFLLFTVELLAARHVLPRFGGAAAVWIACLVFFQVLLLLGYAWSRVLSERSAAFGRAHLVVLGLGVASIAVQWLAWGVPLLSPAAAPREAGTLGVLLHLSVAAGLPFLALAATAPLIQAWEAKRGSPAPWRLYALSNVGALAALALYPFVIEPNLGLRAQAVAWAALFTADMALLAWVTISLSPVGERAGVRATPPTGSDAPAPGMHATELTAASALPWLALSAAGAFALAAVTNFQTHDLTPAPMLWALPLAIYLISFIVTFEHERWYRREVALLLIAAGVLAVTWCMATDTHGLLPRCLAFGAFELGVCLAAHGELYRLRPAPSQLGRYYLWLSVGGALGTATVSVLFPLVTRDYVEFPVLVTAAALAAILLLPPKKLSRALGAVMLVSLLVGFVYVWNARRSGQTFSERNFFGVLRVEKDDDAWVLIHGGTVHGRQPLDPAIANEPSAYFARETGLGLAVKSQRERRGTEPLNAAILGLGIGTSVALFEKGDEVVFYEIDPAVKALAEGQGGWFGYLPHAAASWRVELGDARAMLALAPPNGPLDLLAVDVFSGDAVPMHLLTEEALQLYLAKLKPDGVLALHLSNRFFELDRVALGLAAKLELPAVAYENPPSALAASARWVLLARSEDVLPKIAAPTGGTVWREVKNPAPWTDDLSSVFTVTR